MNTYYDVLEIKKGSSKNTIKSAYRRLAKKYHPDISTENNAEEIFIEITEAYQYLIQGRAPEQSTEYSTFESIRSNDDLRRESARRYAQMQFDAFRRQNDAFKKAWYYNPAKYFSYTLIYLIYALSITMFLSPLLTFIFTNEGSYALGCIFFVLLSSHFYTLARELQKGIKPYFENYR